MTQSYSRRGVLAGTGFAAAAISTPWLAGCSSAAGAGQVTTDQVPVGGALLLPGDYVITQPTAGQFRAFDKTCPHAGCEVSEVREDAIVCTCHASFFSVSDGSPLRGPAATGLAEVPLTVEGDRITIG